LSHGLFAEFFPNMIVIDGQFHFAERPGCMRLANSALYVDQVAAPATPDPFIQLLLTGECFRPLYEYERALIQFKLAYPAVFK
jgi:hypothetical protein